MLPFIVAFYCRSVPKYECVHELSNVESQTPLFLSVFFFRLFFSLLLRCFFFPRQSGIRFFFISSSLFFFLSLCLQWKAYFMNFYFLYLLLLLEFYAFSESHAVSLLIKRSCSLKMGHPFFIYQPIFIGFIVLTE